MLSIKCYGIAGGGIKRWLIVGKRWLIVEKRWLTVGNGKAPFFLGVKCYTVGSIGCYTVGCSWVNDDGSRRLPAR